MNENEQQRSDVSFTQAIEEGQLEEDIYWAYQALSRIENGEDVDEVCKRAPTPGASGLLRYAADYRRDFFKDILPKALSRKKQDAVLKDDGRKRVEIFDQIYNKLSQEYESERKCPMCGRSIAKLGALFRRPKKSCEELSLQGSDTRTRRRRS